MAVVLQRGGLGHVGQDELIIGGDQADETSSGTQAEGDQLGEGGQGGIRAHARGEGIADAAGVGKG